MRRGSRSGAGTPPGGALGSTHGRHPARPHAGRRAAHRAARRLPLGERRPRSRSRTPIETALRALPHLTVDRYGNNVVARTGLGRAERVILAGHIDTVPIADNVPSRLDEDGVLWGCGTCDMKSGVAVQLRIAATVPEPNRDLTFVFYDNEEVAADLNGLKHVAEAHPDWLEGDFAVLLEPSDGAGRGRLPGHAAGRC